MTISALSDERSHDSGRIVVLLLVLFGIFQAVLFAFSDGSCFDPATFCGTQTDRYGYQIAAALKEYGAFVWPEDPSAPYTGHPPGYALFMAGVFSVFGWDSYVPVIGVQMLLLVGVAFMIRSMVNTLLPGYGALGMALILFNPNILAHLNLTQNVSLEFFFVTIALFSTLAYWRDPKYRHAAICGVAVGLAMMTRPSGQFLLVSLPVLFILLEAVSVRILRWKRAIGAGVLSAGLAVAIAAPWVLHMRTSGEGFRLSSAAHEALLLQDSLRHLYPGKAELGNQAAEARFRERQDAYLRAQNPDWDSLSRIRRGQLERDYLIDYYLSFPFDAAELAREVAISWGTFLAGGGEGMMHRFFGMEYQPQKSPALFYGTKTVALVFAIALRILGLVGIVEMVRRRDFGPLLITMGLVAVYVVPSFLAGQPRYRVVVEPALLIMALYGISYLHGRLRAATDAHRGVVGNGGRA